MPFILLVIIVFFLQLGMYDISRACVRPFQYDYVNKFFSFSTLYPTRYRAIFPCLLHQMIHYKIYSAFERV